MLAPASSSFLLNCDLVFLMFDSENALYFFSETNKHHFTQIKKRKMYFFVTAFFRIFHLFR
jgi:uncharacterized pyridoxamine 5'-phosphate oxidase family protein